MADNVAITAGSGTSVATDDVSGAHYQRVKIDLGGDGAASPLLRGQQAKAASLPVTLASDEDDVAITLDGEAVVLGAGTAAIGKLAANSGVDIGDVDILSVTPGTAAAHLGKAEDAAHSSGDVGVMALALRDDTLAAASGTEGDYEPLHTNNNGALFVDDIPGAKWTAYEDETAAATDDELVAAPAAGLCLYVTDIVVTNDGTAAVTIKFLEDTGSAKTQKTGIWKIPASGGIVVNLRTPIKCTAAKNFGYTSTGTSNYSVFVAGYTAA